MNLYKDPSPPIEYPSPLVVLFAVLVVIGFLVFGIAKFVTRNAVPTEFLDLYKEIDTIAKDIANLSSFNFNELSSFQQSSNFSAAYQAVDKAYTVNRDNFSKMNSLIQKTTDIKKLLTSINNVGAQEVSFKLVDKIDERNQRFAKILDFQRQLFEVLKNYYGLLAQGQKPSGVPTIDQAVALIIQESKDINQLQFEIEQLYEEFLKKADLDQSSYTISSDRINSAIPTQAGFNLGDGKGFPTMIPTATAMPTPTLRPTIPPYPTSATASLSATPTASASAN